MRVALLLLLLVSLARAEDIYVAQNAAGADDGTSTNNARALSWLNTSGNWGSGAGKVSPGDTVWLCNTITNQARFFTSGSAGNRISFRGTNCHFVLSAAIAYSAISMSNFNYLTVDGGLDGSIRFTDNGDLLTYQLGNHGIMGQPTGDSSPTTLGEMTIENWRITNIYVFNTGSVFVERKGSGVYINGGVISNIIVRNITTHWADKAIYVSYGGGGLSFNWQIYSNTAQNCVWGTSGADSAAASKLANLYVHHNKSDGHSAWDSQNDGGGNNYHINGSYFWAEQSGSTLSNCYYYANRHGPDMSHSGTSCIFSTCADQNMRNINVYNNVLLGYPAAAAGMVCLQGGIDFRIFNNTFASENGITAARYQIVTGVIYCANNLFFNVGTPASITDTVRQNASPFLCDYNSFYSLNPNGGAWGDSGQYPWDNPSFPTGPAGWHSQGGYDTHSITNGNASNNPLLVNTNSPYDMHIQAGSPVIGAGTDLSSLAFPGQSVDFDGVTRPTLPSIGAFEYVAPAAPLGPQLNVSGTLRVGTILSP